MFSCHDNGVTGTGASNADVVFVGIAPGRDEFLNSRQPFTGQSGKLLTAVMRAYGLVREECYLTNLICWWKDSPDEDEIAACASRLRREIESTKPKVIVALGALASKRFASNYNQSFANLQGSCVWSDEFDCWVICTYHPAGVLRTPALIADLVRDIDKISLIKDQPKDFGHVDFEVIHDVAGAQSILNRLNPKFLANDVETKYDWAQKKYTSEIRCLSISDGDMSYVFPKPVLDLAWPLNRNWTFHNSQFDTRIIRTDLGIELPIVEDTLLMSYSLDERGGSKDESPVDLAVGIHGLKRLSREYCGADFYDVDPKSVSDEELWEYNAKDAAYTARLAEFFYGRQLADGRTREVYERLTLPQMRVSRDEFEHGVYVHKAILKDVAIKWMEEWIETENHLVEEATIYGWSNDKRFNFNSPAQLKKFINNYLFIDVPNTRKETLEPYEDHPWINKYRRIKRIDKQLNTYVLGTRNVLYEDGRVRPDASIHATQTGRLSYHRPPIGTVPTGAQYVDPDEEPDETTLQMIKEFSQIRGLFGAPDDCVFIEADYATAELWVAAYYSQDDVMLDDLMSGDFHSRASESMFKVKKSDYDPSQWKQIRRESKYVTFGVLYNRGAKSLYKPAPGQGGNLGKKYSLRQIEEMVRAWHARYYKHAAWAAQEVRRARELGEQENIAGRKRRYHVPDLYGYHFANMAVNFPIQSTAHDHLILARIELDELYREGKFPARSLWDGHDAIYFECPKDVQDEAVATIAEVMQRPRWFERGLPVEIKVGSSWSDGKVVYEGVIQ